MADRRRGQRAVAGGLPPSVPELLAPPSGPPLLPPPVARETPPVIIHLGGELDEKTLAELKVKLREALRTGKTTILRNLPPEPGTWELTVKGGPDFAARAALACRDAAHIEYPGPGQAALLRLAAALDTAVYGGDPEDLS